MITNFDDWRGFSIDVHHVFTVIVTVPCKYEMWKITRWWLRWRQRKKRRRRWWWLWLIVIMTNELQVQGMSFIAAVLLLNMDDVDTFICFANLLNKPCEVAFFRLDENLVRFSAGLCSPQPCVGSGAVRIDQLRFLAGCRTRRLNCLSYILACFIVLLFIRAPFYVLLVFVAMCSVFSVVLVKLSVLVKWLARRTPLRKPNHGAGIISRKPRPKTAHDFLSLLYCFIVLLCICVVSCPYVIYYPTVMARYSLFELKVPHPICMGARRIFFLQRRANWAEVGWGSLGGGCKRGAHIDFCTIFFASRWPLAAMIFAPWSPVYMVKSGDN